MKINSYIFLLIILLVPSLVILAQEEPIYEDEEEISADTVCFRYNFFPKDTLIYKLEALDSISTLDEKPFFRKRTEYIQFIVDSIDRRKNFYITGKTIAYQSKEWAIDGDTIHRNTANHIGKTFILLIDSLGNRLRSRNISNATASTSPGGLFQPVLFFPLSETCKKPMQSWLVRSSDTLVENSFPPAIINNTSLMKISKIVREITDTLALITFVRTGKGFYAIAGNELEIEMSGITNSYGELLVSLTQNVPVKFYMTQELKIMLKVDEETEQPSWQNTIVVYELVSHSHNDQAIQDEIQKMRKELKKKK